MLFEETETNGYSCFYGFVSIKIVSNNLCLFLLLAFLEILPLVFFDVGEMDEGLPLQLDLVIFQIIFFDVLDFLESLLVLFVLVPDDHEGVAVPAL